MNVVFRVDSSAQLGTGHVMRCLTLADELRRKGVNVSFISRELPGNISSHVEKKGFKVYRMPEDSIKNQRSVNKIKIDADETKAILQRDFECIDWMIVDHYALDAQWETQMRKYVKKIMVIDDLANRPHDCDLLLDQNLYIDNQMRYKRLVPEHCRILLGPQNVLLRHEFIKARKKLKKRDGQIKRILIFFGGSDLTHETVKSLEALRLLKYTGVYIDVVVGRNNPDKEEIKKLCRLIPNANYFYQVENMAQLMVEADLALGAGGTATWERCFLGLPAIITIVANNQKENAINIAKVGAAINLGWHTAVTCNQYAESVEELFINPLRVQDMSQKALRLMNNGSCTGVEKLIKNMEEINGCFKTY